MPSSPLSGKPGNCIKSRLESAAVRLKQVHGWEDLRIYLIQNEKWIWDNDILLDWQQDITRYFLECCKDHHDDQTIADIATALEDGQQLRPDTKTSEAVESSEEEEYPGTIRLPNHPETHKPDKIIFLVSWGKKKCDGISVNYSNILISRISEKIVQRWEREEETYETLIPGEWTGQKALAIDLTWERGGKTQMTTFEVVSDRMLEYDAEFGQNRFDPPLSKSKGKGHSVSKSEPALETSHSANATGLRSHSAYSPSNSHRRQTISSSAGRPARVDRDEFVRRHLVEGLITSANLEYDRQEQALQADAGVDDDDDDDDDESMFSGRGPTRSTPGTHLSARKKDHHRRRKK